MSRQANRSSGGGHLSGHSHPWPIRGLDFFSAFFSAAAFSNAAIHFLDAVAETFRAISSELTLLRVGPNTRRLAITKEFKVD